MVKKIIVVLALFMVFLQVASAEENTQYGSTQTIAYYFHGSFRCVTCNNMEKYSREAIEVNFKDDLRSGKLEFKAVNVEDRSNEHFVNDYQLYTKSLILSLVKDGKEIKSKNLDKIWEYSRNKQKFIDYVTGEIIGFMKDVQ